jgi:acetyltransferase-like isoleucine patch superfamily enzyme
MCSAVSERPHPGAVELLGSAEIDPRAIVGHGFQPGGRPARLGDGAVIRAFCVIHAGVTAGARFRTGHYVLIREDTEIGDDVLIGTGSTVDGNVRIGSKVKIESQVYVPTHTVIGNRVFIGPGAVLTNDRYPLRQRDSYQPEGPVLEEDVTIGGGAVLLPGVRIGAGAFIAAGAVVTHDVPEWKLAAGNPARVRDLPEKLRERNWARSW